MEYRTLGKTNLKVSALGFGGSSLGSVFRRIDESETVRTVQAALAEGINYFDTAPFYGLTKAEEVLGRALEGISRDRYYLATKVGRYGEQDFDFSAKRTHKSVDESLGRLGVDYVDVIQCHDIEYGSVAQIVEETIPALREIVKQGKARFIGITGFPLAIYSPVLSQTPVDVVLSYCHYTLNNTALSGILPLFEKHGVGVINASPLAMGLLTDQGPPDWHPAGAEIKETCAVAARMCRERNWNLAELAIQFSLANLRVQTTLIGMATREELTQNLRAAARPLQQDAIEQVQRVLSSIQGKTWTCQGQNIIDEDVLIE
jgi:L-galactose dehydrogenase